MKQLPVLLFVFFFISSCSNKITAPLTNVLNTELVHHKWKVTQMHGVTEPLPYIYLDMRDVLKTNASAGCDSVIFTPKYSFNNRVDFSFIQIALSMCKGRPLLDQQFLKNLYNVYYFSVEENKLSLFNKNRIKLFEAVYDEDDEQGSLQRHWQISFMMNADAEKLSESKPFLDFTNLNFGAAYVGCNQFSFPVMLSTKHQITMGNAAITKKYCEHNSVNDEVLSKILPLVKMYQIMGNTLKLLDKDNALLIQATAPL